MSVIDNIREEYYPISMEILTSFNKYYPPVDFFEFREDLLQLVPFSRKGARFSDAQVERVADLCTNEILFASRSDLPIYGQHIAKQIELVLLDPNFTSKEVAHLVRDAFRLRLYAFLDQPVKPVYEMLYKDLMVFTELLSKDKYLIKTFMAQLYTGEYNLIEHMINGLMIGMWYYLLGAPNEKSTRKLLDNTALAYLMMNAGMSKVPVFILSKKHSLTPPEQDKVIQHSTQTIRMLQKLEILYPECQQAAFEHHERLDGAGYPSKSKNISKIGRIAAIADSFSAMLMDRPYAKGKGLTEALQELLADPRYDKALLAPLANAYLTKGLQIPQAETFGQA